MCACVRACVSAYVRACVFSSQLLFSSQSAEFVSKFLDFKILSTVRGHLRMNPTFKILLHQFKTHITSLSDSLLQSQKPIIQPSSNAR